MTTATVFRHVVGLCGQPFWFALIAAALVKAVWGAQLRRLSYAGLATRLFVGNVFVVVGGLFAERHDGRMSTHLVMVLMTALVSGWSLARQR